MTEVECKKRHQQRDKCFNRLTFSPQNFIDEIFTDVNDFSLSLPSDCRVLSGESNKLLHFLISMATSISITV